MPGQKQRSDSVRQKLNAIDLEFRGKNVLLVDDSIVRGTTITQIIQMAREAGARKVYMASAAHRHCATKTFTASICPRVTNSSPIRRTEQEVAHIIGADWLVYQSIEDLKKSCHEGNPHVRDFECSAFDGRYITGDVGADYLARLSAARSDASKRQQELSFLVDTNVLELHNHS